MEVRNNINVHIFRSLSTTIAAWSMVPLTVVNVVSTTGFGFRSVEGISQSASMIMWWGSGIIAVARYKKTSMHARWLALDYEWKKIRDQVDDGDNIDIRTLKVFWIVLRFAYMVFDDINSSSPNKREASSRDGAVFDIQRVFIKIPGPGPSKVEFNRLGIKSGWGVCSIRK